MPATDWREITYSRAQLRPNDGRDPVVKQLYSECKTITKRIATRPSVGVDFDASAKDLEDYSRATHMKLEAEARARNNEEKIRADELKRQEVERKNLTEALKMRREAFDEEWAHKREEMEARCREKMQGNKDRAEGQRVALELMLKKAFKTQPKVKYSVQVRDDRILEAKHANAFEFDLASRFSKSMAMQKTLEEERHVRGIDGGVEKRRKRLELRLEKEEEDMRDACDRMRLAFEFKFKSAQERQRQLERNMRHDSEHAMANEFAQHREVRKSLTTTTKLVKSYSSRPATSSTFFGRNMMERAGRGSRDVPSVCRMEWADIPATPRFDPAAAGKAKH